MMHLSPSNSAAFYLGIALRKRFPHAQYLGSSTMGDHFSVTFQEKSPFHKSFLELLEREMRELMEKSPVSREMLVSNAAALFSHHGEEGVVAQLSRLEGLVVVAELGGVYDIVEGEVAPFSHFSLLHFAQEKGRVEITGIAKEGAKGLKEVLKRIKNYPKVEHVSLAKELELYEEESWHPRGMVLRQVLSSRLEKFYDKKKFELIETPSPSKYHTQTARNRFFQWVPRKDEAFLFKEEQDGPLHLLKEWLSHFPLRVRFIFSSGRGEKRSEKVRKLLTEQQIPFIERGMQGDPTLGVSFLDGIDREIEGPKVVWCHSGIHFSLCGDQSCFIQALLEETKGELPFYLAPEQVRVIPLEGGDPKRAIQILTDRQIRFSIDQSPHLLKEKMHRALRLKIPYVMVVGKRESETGQFAVRALGSSQNQRLTDKEMELFFVELNRCE